MHGLPVAFIPVMLGLTTALPELSHRGRPFGIPIYKRSTLERDGVVNLDAIRSHIAHLERKYFLNGVATSERHPGGPSLSLNGHTLAGRAGSSVPLLDNENAYWYGTISVGTPPIEFKVDFDTGSAGFFLPALDCDTCDGHTRYDPSASSSAVDLNQAFSLTYADGSTVSGNQYVDTVTIAGLVARNQSFGAALQYSTTFQSANFVPDGVVGLAFADVSLLQGNSIIQTLIEGEQISDPVFAFKLASEGSELVIGGVDTSSFIGSFTFAPVTVQRFWQINLDSVNINDQPIFKDASAVVDTGATFIFGNAGVIGQFYSALNATDVGDGLYTMPCDAMPNVSITISGKLFSISAETFNAGAYDDSGTSCVGGIAAHGSSNNTWVLGDVFLRNVYTVFDVGSLRVGFADLA